MRSGTSSDIASQLSEDFHEYRQQFGNIAKYGDVKSIFTIAALKRALERMYELVKEALTISQDMAELVIDLVLDFIEKQREAFKAALKSNFGEQAVDVEQPLKSMANRVETYARINGLDLQFLEQ